MKTSSPPATVRTLRAENAELRARLQEAEDTLRAIRAGDVDALVVEGDNGPQIFTLQGLDAEQNRSRGEMLAQVSDSVIAVDNEDHITFLNVAAERQYGIRADEVVGCKLASVITRQWPSPEAEAEMWTAMSGRGEWRGELIHRTHDGRELHVESSVAALRGLDGERIGVVRTIRDVSERKRTEAALRESEVKLRMAFASMTEAIFIADADGRLTDFNDEFVRYHRFKNRDECSRTIVDCPKYLDAYFADGTPAPPEQWAMTRALRGETATNVEYRLCRKETGESWWGSYSFGPIQEKDGGFVGAVVSCRDITTLKQAELALQESRKQLQAIIDGTPAIVYAFDLEARFVLANAALAEMLNSTPEQMIGKRRHELMLQRDAEWHDANDRQVLELGGVLELEEHSEIKGRQITWLTAKFPLRDAQGEIHAVAGISTDITKRKQAEEELRESEVKLRDQLSRLALLEQITRGISSRLDFQHILKVVTHSLEDALPVDFCCVCLFDEQAKECAVAQVGLKSAPLALELGMPEQAVISLDCLALAPAARGELSYLPDVRKMEFPFLQRLAAAGLRSLVVAPLPQEGKVIGFLVVARREERGFLDGECEFLKQLSEHVALACQQAKLHDSLQAAYDALRRTQQAAMQRDRLRALGQMASGITHDISNAISPVTLYAASLLEHESDLSVRARDYLQTIHHSVQSVAETISRMREFYRPGEPQVMLTPTDLNHLAQQAWDLTRVRWSDSPHERGIVIQTEVRWAEDLPDIMGVESEIRDAIVNLIFNAVDAMPEGGTLTLRTVTKPIAPGPGGTPDARQVCLELIDTGIGMDEDTRRRCLEPFFTTKGEHGTGLGLAMVYGMITRHRARIELDSTPGQGTTVRLLFPVSAVASNGVDQPWQAKPEPANQRILFIDDDPLLIKSMRDTLETDGHTVVTAASGQEGIQAFIHAHERKEAFTVVITDLGMPHMDGRKVASAVKAASPSTPVIMLTGWGQQLEAEGDIPAQVDRLLSKPPNLRDLREALAACCPPDQSKPTNA